MFVTQSRYEHFLPENEGDNDKYQVWRSVILPLSDPWFAVDFLCTAADERGVQTAFLVPQACAEFLKDIPREDQLALSLFRRWKHPQRGWKQYTINKVWLSQPGKFTAHTLLLEFAGDHRVRDIHLQVMNAVEGKTLVFEAREQE